MGKPSPNGRPLREGGNGDRKRSVAPIQETRGKVRDSACALIEFYQEIRIEQWILIRSILRIAAWIAHYPCSIHEVVEAVMGMSVYP